MFEVIFGASRRLRSKSRKLHCQALEDRRLLAFGILHETGNFVAEVERLKQLAFEKDSGAYVAPNAAELADFSSLASTLLSGDLAGAAVQADAIDYALVEFTDSTSGITAYALREQLVGGAATRGWGSYFVNFQHHADAIVEVPQPLFDVNSWELGAKAFLNSEARGFLLAGAHRNANGTGSADVAHLSQSIFQTVHEAWNGTGGETSPWQIHGFALSKHDGDSGEDTFPAGTDVISSNGDGAINAGMIDLDGRLEAAGFAGFTYNSIDPSDPLNVQVNDGVDGQTFVSLAAATNVQGIHSRGIGGDFMHVEFEQSIRFDHSNLDAVSGLVADSMLSQPAFFVRGAQLSDGHTQLTVDFSAAVDASSLVAGDLTVDGVAAVAANLVDADTVVFDLPALELGSHTLHIADDELIAAGGVGVNDFQMFAEITVGDPPASGTKFFVVDTSGDSTHEYDANGILLDSYGLAPGNTMPRGAASDAAGTTVWVVDNDDYVYVYDADGQSLGLWKANGLSKPEGIATDGVDIWIVDRGTDRVYYFADGAAHRSSSFNATSSFKLANYNKNPRGITTDGNSLWVVDWSSSSSEKVFKYAVDGTALGSWIIDPGNSSPRGIAIDPNNPSDLWIVDNSADSIFQYLGAGDRSSGSQDADAVFALLGTNPQGITDPLATADTSISIDASISDGEAKVASFDISDDDDLDDDDDDLDDDDLDDDDLDDDDLDDDDLDDDDDDLDDDDEQDD